MSKPFNIAKQTSFIPSTEGLPIRYDVYHPQEFDASKMPTILFLHGFKGFKDWGTFPLIGERLSEKGFAVVAVNFSLNGIGENPLWFDRLDLFARETFSQDLDDIGTVLEGIREGAITAGGHQLNTRDIGILGHSRGGQTAIAAAAEYPEIECLVTWSAVSDYLARWSDAMKEDWETRGVTEIKNGRTGQTMLLEKVVYDDARDNSDRVIAINRVRELEMPTLFIHSKDDEAVPVSNANQLFEGCGSEIKELMLLENTGHTFDGKHPFEADEFPAALQKAFDATGNWFVEKLK